MFDFKSIIFPLLETFKKDGGLEWAEKLKKLNEEQLVEALETVHETVKNIVYHAAILPGIDEKERETLIGRLSICAANLFHAPGRFTPEKMTAAVAQFEKALQAIIQKSWIDQARERFDEFEELEQSESEEEISPEKIDYLRPVFFSFDLFELVTFDPESDDEFEDEETEEEEEFEEDEE